MAWKSRLKAMFCYIIKSFVTLVCLEMAPKTDNSDHVFGFHRVVLCKVDATERVQEHGSVQRASLVCCAT